VPGAAEQAARAVVLEAAGEDAAPGGKQRGRDRVSFERLDRLAVEAECEAAIAVQTLPGLRWEAHQAAGASGVAGDSGPVGASQLGVTTSVLTTVFVRVSRSA
jgi:hypothetical protein